MELATPDPPASLQGVACLPPKSCLNFRIYNGKAAFTRQRSVQKRGNVCVFRCSVLAVYTTPFFMECGCGVFMRARCYSLVCTNQSERRNSLLIDAVPRLYPAFFASIKAEVCSYKKLYERFHVSVFEVSTLVSVFISLRFTYAFSSFWCKRTTKTDTKVFVFTR